MKIKSLFFAKENHVIDNGISQKEASDIAKKIHLKPTIPFDEFLAGANDEIEHKKEVDNSPTKIGEIAVDHLSQDPHYYSKIKKMEEVHESLSLSAIFETIITNSPTDWLENAQKVNSPGTKKLPKSKKKSIDYSKIKNKIK